MKELERFDTLDFLGQVNLLDSLVQNGSLEALPDVIQLMERIPRSDAIGLVIRNTLKGLLSSGEDQTAQCIASDNREVKTIAIEVAGQKRFAGAAGALLEEARKAAGRQEYGVLFAAISALSAIGTAEAFDLFRECMDSEDPLISSQCIEILGELRDEASVGRLCGIVSRSDAQGASGECDLPTASAITALGRIRGSEAVSFLVSKLHHRSPAARRLIHEALAAAGAESVGPLAEVFQEDDVDKKILAANILGLIGSREAGDVLVRALDKGQALHPNIRFAVYEAMGRTPGMKTLVCLADGLEETDQMVLMAVISSLDVQLNPWIRDRMAESIRKGTAHSSALVKAIAASRSLNIFEALFGLDEAIGALIADAVRDSGDGELTEQFRGKLKEMGTNKALAIAAGLEGKAGNTGGRKILAVDDSKAMLNYYQSITASMGLTIATAENGRQGLDVLAAGEPFCLVITDMNMPVMDGIEFTRQVRDFPDFEGLPVIMITTESERSQQVIAREAGVTEFLQKPFSMEKLRELIGRYL